MAVGFSAAAANTALDAMAAAFPWVKLHIGDPGAAGTSNPATETARKLPTFSAAAGGAKTNTNYLTWFNVAGSEDYTHFSLWSAVSGGTFGGSGTVTAVALVAAETFQVAPGDLDLSLPLAS